LPFYYIIVAETPTFFYAPKVPYLKTPRSSKEKPMNLSHVTIYTDGGANPNPGAGGWGVLLIADNGVEKELSGSEKNTTNNRMELRAVIEALRALKRPCAIDLYVDSEYVKKGVTEWMEKWIKNNWINSQKESVKNRDLWEILNKELTRHKVQWHWVKGHAGNVYNERVDQLATAARSKSDTESE
jgi:ribonuclease HI